MPSSDHARAERAALCKLFEEVGPDAPTLCEGWTARDLAAHLIVREHRPDAGLGIVVPAFAAHGDRVRLGVAARPWATIVEEVRAGPPIWNPTRFDAIDRLVNTVEYFVHHEDVRRAVPEWQARDLDPDLESQLWDTVRRTARFSMRSAPVGVTVATPDGREAVAKDATPMVRVVGPPGELALFAAGRGTKALVRLEGDPDDVDALWSARFGV
jgi:uncharacterized protein (TIGR03085 family)